MTDEVVTNPGEEAINVATNTAEQPVVEVVEEKPVGEMIEKPKEANLIPESVFLGEKKARKAAEKELRALKESIQNGASNTETSEDIDELAEEFGVDKGFLKKFASQVKKEAQAELEEKIASLNKKDVESFDTAFDKSWKLALERGPEFSTIANMDVIKSLALLPQNAKKTITQILEETYSNALTGKRTVDTTTPAGGKDPEPLDFNKARSDGEYFKEVMANPELKKKYNERMLKEGF